MAMVMNATTERVAILIMMNGCRWLLSVGFRKRK